MKYRSTKYFVYISTFIISIFTILRVLFFMLYLDRFSLCSTAEIFVGFINGLRFDAATFFLMSLPFLFIIFLPFIARFSIAVKIIGLLHLITFIPVLLWQLVDIHYYGYVNRRISFEIFSIFSDIPAIGGMIIIQYWRQLIVTALFLGAFVFLWMRTVKKISNAHAPHSLTGELLRLVLLCCVAIVGLRGGFQYKPLRVSFAFQNEKTILGHLSLNGVYTTYHAIRKQRTQHAAGQNITSEEVNAIRNIVDNDTKQYGNDAYPLYRKNSPSESAPAKNYNIVLIIMESWSAFFVGALGGEYACTPQFDLLAKEGLLCTHFFASGLRSTEACAAIVGSLPALPDMQIINTSLEQNIYSFLPQLLKQSGYETLFIHGGRRGTMGFDAFAKLAGFNRHISRENFDNLDITDDGVWGIWDEYAFERMNDELKKIREPFHALFFSLTSHDPPVVPSSEFARFGNDVPNNDFLNTIYYADYALGKFFKLAQHESYFNRTLFIIMADHTDGHFKNIKYYDMFRIPCLLYAPHIINPGVYEQLAGQMDIVPTVIDMVGINVYHASFGKSIFQEEENRYVTLNNTPVLGWVEGGYLTLLTQDQTLGLYEFEKDKSMTYNLQNVLPDTCIRYETRARTFADVTQKMFYYNRVMK